MTSRLKIWVEVSESFFTSRVDFGVIVWLGIERFAACGASKAYFSQSVVALDGTLLVILLEIHGFDVVPYADHDETAIGLFAVEEFGERIAEEVAVIVAVEVDGAVHVRITLPFKFERIKVGAFRVHGSIWGEARSLPFDLSGVVGL